MMQNITELDSTYSCDICKKEFKYKTNIYRHKSKLNKHISTHNKEVLVCEKCDRLFHRKDFYKKHISKCEEVFPTMINTNLSSSSIVNDEDDILNQCVPSPDVPSSFFSVESQVVPSVNSYVGDVDVTPVVNQIASLNYPVVDNDNVVDDNVIVSSCSGIEIGSEQSVIKEDHSSSYDNLEGVLLLML